jgi:hypothetical protein
MANVLNMDKQIMIIGALAEGSSIRSIERMTGVHRDTIVEVFDLKGHPRANTAYAWSQDADDPDKQTLHFTVLHIPPAVSPETAVRAVIAQEFRNANA